MRRAVRVLLPRLCEFAGVVVFFAIAVNFVDPSPLMWVAGAYVFGSLWGHLWTRVTDGLRETDATRAGAP